MSNADRSFVVTIDGPAASGKSSTAARVAVRLGVRHADSGALYRAATLARLRRAQAGGEWSQESVLEAAAAVSISRNSATFDVLVNGSPPGADLHAATVTQRVSAVAAMPLVRAWVNAQMHRCALDGPVVVDGRDMGTAVFPGAGLKVFLVADAAVRARRRLLQRTGRAPLEGEIAVEELALRSRDAKDARQTKAAADAVVIDTTLLTQDEQVERIVELALRAGAPRT